MSTIAVIMVPEPGHFLPTLRIGSALRSNGHDVTYLSLPQFRQFFTEQGFRFHPVFSEIFTDDTRGDMFAMRNTIFMFQRKIMEIYSLQSNTGFIDLVLPSLREIEADVLLCDSLLGASECATISEELKTPAVLLTTYLTRRDSTFGLPEIVFCPKEFEIPADASLVPNRHYAEPSVYRGRPARSFPWEFLNPKRKLVYCSLGTQCCEFATAPDLLWMIIEAFGGLPEHQLVLASGGVDLCGGDKRAPLPANVMVVTSAPQLELLERADLMITHGGLGSIKEAILAGVPVIVVPFVNDQPANGKRIEYHGLGRVLASAECSPEKIRQAVLDVGTNGLIRSCVLAMNATFRAYEQAAPAVNLIRASVPTS